MILDAPAHPRARGTRVRPPRTLDAEELSALARLRRVAADLPGSREARSFGHPAFRVGGKAYAVLDRYAGTPCLWLKVDPMERRALLARPGWHAAPYDPRRAALCCRLDAIDWRRVRRLLRMSYALANLKPPRRAG